MKRTPLSLALILFPIALLAVGLHSTHAQQRQAPAQPAANKPKTPDNLPPAEIIKRFTSKESELREEWKDYAYRQETRLQVIGPANTISGEYFQVSEFVFNDAGKRVERIVRAPQSTLDQAGLTMTAEDKNALINLQPFALATDELPNYNLNYVGREKLDELNTYVFEVIPKVISDPKTLKKGKDSGIEGKYFQGRIWVDDQDLQIVKTAGKTVPEFKQRFPRFETYRENIDGRYWFPTYTYGDDELDFEKGPSIHVRLVIKYRDYRRFQSDVKITGATEEDSSKTPPKKP
jgi:hypothetical protein